MRGPGPEGVGERGRRHRRGGHRLFDYGDLRLLLLALIAEKPSHGYELIKAVEERFGGGYTPSPGVIYPTLAWLDDMGYAEAESQGAGRKQYKVTAEGEAFIAANRAAIEDILARAGGSAEGAAGGPPTPVIRAMQNLRVALKLRLRKGPMDEATARAVAEALDAAAQAVERS